MRKLLAALGLVLLGAAPALADAFSDQYTGMVGRIPLLTSPHQSTDYLSVVRNGIPYKIPVPLAFLLAPTVPNNAALLALAGTSVDETAYRAGFTTPGDGGGAAYTWSTTACSLSSGAGDNGSQVRAAGGGCWNIDVNAQQLVPEIWGAVGNGTADDTTAVNAALAYIGTLGSGRLFARAGAQYGISGTITVRQGTSFVGANWDDSRIVLLNGSFSPAIRLEGLTTLQDWYVDGTPQNAGIIIQMGSSGSDVGAYINRVRTNKGCLALDVNGVSHTVRDSSFDVMNAVAGCGGVRVGHSTTAGTTIEFRLVNSLIKCDFTLPNRADYGLRLEDADGIFIGPGVDMIGCIKGAIIKPGANQEVALGYFNDVALGDTNQEEGLLIDTGAASAVVRGNMFVQTWTSASTGTNGITIQNTGGGTISGTSFIGHRAYLNLFNGIVMNTPVSGTITDTTFDAIRICGTQSGTDFIVGDDLDVAIRNSRIGKQCDGIVAGDTTGLLFGIGIGSNVQLAAIGNDLSYSGIETWSPFSGIPTRNSVVANNTTALPLDATYASGATVTLTVVTPRIDLTGATTVDTITPAWNGQELCVISNDGALSFSASGNIAAAVSTSGAGAMVCGFYDSLVSKWRLH